MEMRTQWKMTLNWSPPGNFGISKISVCLMCNVFDIEFISSAASYRVLIFSSAICSTEAFNAVKGKIDKMSFFGLEKGLLDRDQR